MARQYELLCDDTVPFGCGLRCIRTAQFFHVFLRTRVNFKEVEN